MTIFKNDIFKNFSFFLCLFQKETIVFQKSGNDPSLTLSRSLYQVLLYDLKHFSRRNVHISNSPNQTFDFDPNEQKNFKNEPNLIYKCKMARNQRKEKMHH